VEDRIITASSQTRQFEAVQEQAIDQRQKLLRNFEALRKTTNYIGTLVHDGAKVFGDGLAPGEGQLVSGQLQVLQRKLDEQSAATAPNAEPAIDLAEYLLQRTELAVGGYTAGGSAIVAGGNHVLKGTFAFVGPSTYFRADQSDQAGAVWSGTNSIYPVNYPLAGWKREDVAAFFEGKPGTMVADISGGKALRLKETSGTVWTHIQTGGVVAYVIIAVGVLALFLIGQKIRDLARMDIDSPEAVHGFLAAVARGSPIETSRVLNTLHGTTRELFTVGVQHAARPKAMLEEHLQSVLLRQQLHYERRLPLLAVIATAAPLMGLLGTVVGMVKTFALITVFGTGNAGKLASGISQVLVATELGLIVAIPTLIAHGFLAHRIQKNLSLLERYALEFVTATETGRGVSEIEEEPKSMLA
jgi:biopolymer transport protein ExbB